MNSLRDKNDITLAIYPFENLTEGNGLDVFCKSFQVDLVTELSRFRQFRIIAARDHASPSADYVIKGSFHYVDERLRINAQLINQTNNHIVWADRFEGSRESLFAIQENLLREVVSSLQQQLNYDLLTHIRRKTKLDLTAYEHWLYGMEELKKGSLEADEKARTHFQKAIDIDPTYSLACSGMSMTYFNEWSCQLWDRWELSQKGAFEWARRAIELDEQNYVAACVLGRVYLYEGQYPTAEYYLREALRLNPNDTDVLVQIASCFVFLGYAEEAEILYQKVLQLNPVRSNSYRHIGAFIAFERGDYKTSVALGTNAPTAWIDFPAFMAAAYYGLGEHDNMQRCWQLFLENFKTRILKGNQVEEAQAVQWIMNVNPYREKTNFIPFWEFLLGRKVSLPSRFSRTSSGAHENYFAKDNDRWEISFEGETVHLTEVKGFYDIVALLEKPETQFHCTELTGGGVFMSAEPLFDARAKREYKRRISDLQEEIRWCDENNDLQRSAVLHEEYDTLLGHLSSSLGLGGKVRKGHDSIDKIRSAVTWRIRNAIQKISKAHPGLGKHLSLTVRTGLFCSYTPEKPMKWVIIDREPSSLTS